MRVLLFLFLFLCLQPFPVLADTIHVSVKDDVQSVLDNATSGDAIYLEEGIYQGPFIINETVAIKGEKGVRVVGDSQGFVLKVMADDTTVEGLTIEQSGSQNPGIAIKGDRVQVKGNIIKDVFNGIEVKDAYGAVIESNIIRSYTDDRHKGFGVYIVESPHAVVKGNDLSHLQDGVYVSFSDLCQVTGNTIQKARYGVHTMDSTSVVINDNEVFDSRNGLMIMQSYEVRIKGNHLHDNTLLDGAGIFIFDTFDSQVKNNRIVANRRGLYLENAIANDLSFNEISGNHLGLEAGEASKGNTIYLNNFIANNQQVAAAVDSENDFYLSGYGNYWDDQRHVNFDDSPVVEFAYKSGDAFHHMIAEEPLLQAFAGSPAIEMWNTVEHFTPIPSDTFITDPYPLSEPVPMDFSPRETTNEADQAIMLVPALFFLSMIVVSGGLIIGSRRRRT